MADSFPELSEWSEFETKLSDQMIKQEILELDYWKISCFVSASQINSLPKSWQFKAWYFAEPRPIIVNFLFMLPWDSKEQSWPNFS